MTATAPFDTPVEASSASSTELARLSVLNVTVTTILIDGDGEAGSIPGDQIWLKINVTNEGTVSLSSLAITDPLLSTLQAR